MAQNPANPNPIQLSDAAGNAINPQKEDGKIVDINELLKLILVELRVQNLLLVIGLNIKEDLDVLKNDPSNFKDLT